MGPTRLQFTQDKAHLGRVVDEVVTTWLDRCDPYGRGEDLPAASEDLLGELEDHVEAWQEELQHAPSHGDPGASSAALDADPTVVDHRRVST